MFLQQVNMHLLVCLAKRRRLFDNLIMALTDQADGLVIPDKLLQLFRVNGYPFHPGMNKIMLSGPTCQAE